MGESSTTQPGNIGPWVYKAEGDFRTATSMVRKRKEPAPDNVCFCASVCREISEGISGSSQGPISEDTQPSGASGFCYGYRFGPDIASG